MWQLIFEIFCILSGAFVIVMFFIHEGPQEMAERKAKERQARNQFKKIDHAVTVYIAISKQPRIWIAYGTLVLLDVAAI